MNRIYFFTGTGNSLYIAEEIKDKLENCELVAIKKGTDLDIPEDYERIGFVFPNYAGGPPVIVKKFMENIRLKQKNTYLFTVASYGGNAGSIIPFVNDIMEKNNLRLDYGAKIVSYPNAISAYPMLKAFNLINPLTNKGIRKVVNNIVNKERSAFISELNSNKVDNYNKYMGKINDVDKDYNVSDECISCGICQDICPAKNISLEKEKPVFQHNCESCMACIQHCPKKAINYKDKTQKRARYTNSHISTQKLVEYYK